MPKPDEKRRPKSETRQRQHIVGVRMLPEELAKLRTLAKRQGVTPSEFVRRVVASA
jgi:hypothetical protein